MHKSDTGLGLGLVAAMAICCGAKLLIFGLPALALATGQVVLLAAAVVAALAVAGAVVWRRRAQGCAGGSCTPPSTPVQSRVADAEPAGTPSTRQPVAVGSNGRHAHHEEVAE